MTARIIDGAAIAAAAGVPANRVTIVGGATARVKRVRVAGDARAIAAALANAAGEGGRG